MITQDSGDTWGKMKGASPLTKTSSSTMTKSTGVPVPTGGGGFSHS